MKKIFGFLMLLVLVAGSSFAQVPGLVPDRFGKTYSDNAFIRFGNSQDVKCGYDTAQTADAIVCGLSTDSKSFILMDKADIGSDIGAAANSTPTLIVTSTDHTKWLELYHDGSNAYLTTNTGALVSTGGIVGNALFSLGDVSFEGATSDDFETSFTPVDPTADRIITLPNATGTMCVGGNVSLVSGANTACNTTCGSSAKCVGGQNTGDMALVACSTATADVCFCVGQ